MPYHIKNEVVIDLIEQVRIQLGVKEKTEAIRIAMQNELARAKDAEPMRDRLARLRAKAREELGLPVAGFDTKKFMDEGWE